MILADKIINERKKNGWSQEELAEMLSVSRQSVSKWESAQSIPDLQRIIQLASIFGVSTDYLLKDEIEPEPAHDRTKTVYDDAPSDNLQHRWVSMEEANSYLFFQKENAPKVANAVSLCILSPAVLIALAGLADDGIGRVSETMAVLIGLPLMILMIAAAVYIFITTAVAGRRFEYLRKESFETEYGVAGMVREIENDYEPIYTRGLSLGVISCILSPLPLIIAGVVEAPDYVCVLFTSLLLVIVAAAVNGIVRVALKKESFSTLLQEGEFARREKLSNKKMHALSEAYWCVVTAVYLGWSFWTGNWNISWLIWPVAGVLSAAFKAIIGMFVME